MEKQLLSFLFPFPDFVSFPGCVLMQGCKGTAAVVSDAGTSRRFGCTTTFVGALRATTDAILVPSSSRMSAPGVNTNTTSTGRTGGSLASTAASRLRPNGTRASTSRMSTGLRTRDSEGLDFKYRMDRLRCTNGGASYTWRRCCSLRVTCSLHFSMLSATARCGCSCYALENVNPYRRFAYYAETNVTIRK